MADIAIRAPATVAAPRDYIIPGAQELLPKSVKADMDGTSATSTWYPVLQVLDPGGSVMFSAIYPTGIAAGASANVTWFPGAEPLEAEAGAVGVIVETLLVDSRVQAGATASTVLVSGQEYVITAQGTFSVWNAALGTGTPNADAMFPTPPPPARASTQVGLDPECAFAVLTAGGTSLGYGPFLLVNLGSGFTTIVPQDGTHATPAPNYIYTYTVTGQGSAPTFKVNDQPGQFTDNYGYVQITIQSVSGQSSGGGGGGSLLPPDGSSQSILRAVSGVPAWKAQPNISEPDFTFTDIATANSSTAKHGLLRKLDNNSAHFLDGTGAWASPPSGTIGQITSTGSSITVGSPTGPTTNVDVANSGVAGGTYGDSTHVAQVTVGADGRVTNATSVAVSGSAGAGGLITLFDSTLGAAAATIDTGAGGIATGHGNLLIFIYARSAAALTSEPLLMRFNNDSTTNYSYHRLQQANTTVTGLSAISSGAIAVGTIAANSATANLFTGVNARVPNYDNAANFASGDAVSSFLSTTAANNVTMHTSFAYYSTTAITRLAIVTNSGSNLMIGTRLLICGTQ